MQDKKEIKTGTWLHHNCLAKYICSECGNTVPKKENFCNKCGAKMAVLRTSDMKW